MFSSNFCRNGFFDILETTPSSRLQTFQESADGKLHFNAALIKHIEWQHNEVFRKYLKNTEDPPNARDCTGATLLHIAAKYGNEEIVKDLTESTFDVDLQDDLGQTPLMIALKNKHVATANLLLKLNCDVKIKDKVGTCAWQIVIAIDPTTLSCLYYTPATLTGIYWEIVRLMLDEINSDYLFNSEKVAEQLLQIDCPLSHVVFMNNSEVMKIMIEKGCPVNARDQFCGKTALHWAVEYCKLDKMKILLDHGADVDVLDHYEKTPLMYIYFHMYPRVPSCEVELVKMLLERKASMLTAARQDLLKEFHNIFRWGSKDAIRVALEKDDNLLLRRHHGTLLHVLVYNSNPGVAEVIVGRNMDVDCRGMYGEMALFKAIEDENDQLAEILLGEGASLAIESDDRLTPMHLPFIIDDYLWSDDDDSFTIERRLKCLKVMLEHGGDPDTRFKDGKTIFEVILSNQKLFPLAEPVLAQLAIKESLGASVSKVIRQQIRSHEQFNSYFDLCVNQLEEAKTIWLSRSVSLFEFLTSPNKLVSHYARNRILVSKLSELIEQLTFDSYYMGILHKRFSKVSRIAQLRQKAVAIVCENIGKHYGCNPIVTYTIVDFLSDEDVTYLVSCSECSS